MAAAGGGGLLLALLVIGVVVACVVVKKLNRNQPPVTVGRAMAADNVAVASAASVSVEMATPAAAGTSVVPGVVMPAQPQDTVAKLKELKGLLDDGTLTQEEFDFQKRVVLGGKETKV